VRQLWRELEPLHLILGRPQPFLSVAVATIPRCDRGTQWAAARPDLAGVEWFDGFGGLGFDFRHDGGVRYGRGAAACGRDVVLAENLIRGWSGGVVVFVEDAAEPWASADVEIGDLGLAGDRRWQWS
jgi:hypothetical protein